MTPEEYIKSWVVNNSLLLGIISAKYEYHKFDETHFLKLIPSNIVDGDGFKNELSEFIIKFEDTFIGEMICLLSENSLTELENPIELCTSVNWPIIDTGIWRNGLPGIILSHIWKTGFISPPSLGFTPEMLGSYPKNFPFIIEEFNFKLQRELDEKLNIDNDKIIVTISVEENNYVRAA